MSRVYFISDLHLGHSKILDFAGKYRSWGASSIDEHDHILIERIRSVCRNKRDILYILGDVCMDRTTAKMDLLKEIPAKKILVRGNHDIFNMDTYLKYFDKIEGFCRYKNHWLSHCPIHPMEMRGRKNIHGHCVDDKTEILTVDGWKNYSEVKVNDDVYSYNPESKNLEQDKVTEVIVHEDYKGDVVEFNNRSFSMVLTDEHRVTYLNKSNEYNVTLAKDLLNLSKLKLIRSGRFTTEGVNLTDDELRLYIAIAADGNLCNSSLCRFPLKKLRKVEKLCGILDNLSIEYRIKKTKHSTTSVNFTVPDKLLEWRFKGLDRRLVNCTKHQVGIIKETYSWTDGNRNLIFTSKKEEVDLLQWVFSINGYSCKVHEREGHGFSEGISYQLSVYERESSTLTKVKDKTEIRKKREEEVFWCIQNRNKNFLARRGGAVFLTGNCHGNLVMKPDLVYGEVQDENYINVCVENCNGYPVNFADIKDGTFKGEIG